MKHPVILSIVTAMLASAAIAAEKTFDFKDPKGVNTVNFLLDAPLESISGTANGVSGTITVDTEDPSSAKGRIVVAAESLHVPNPMMKEHMHGDKWLNSAENPEIAFEVKEVANVKVEDGKGTADVTGTFTLNGVSKEMTVPVKATYLPGRLKDRMPDANGDLLVIRAEFPVKRSDFEIQPGQNEDKVSDEIKVTFAIAGAAAE